MASPITLTLNGVGDQIAAAIQESFRHHLLANQVPSAAAIGRKVGEKVAATLQTELYELKEPTLDASTLREQSLANANFVLQLYQGQVRVQKGLTLAVIYRQGQTVASVVSDTLDGLSLFCIIEGPPAESDMDALLELYEKTKIALPRAQALRRSQYGFYDFADLDNDSLFPRQSGHVN